MTELDATTLVGLLADDHRRRVFAAVELGARHVDAVCEVTGLSATHVTKALGKLIETGLVVNTADGMSVAANAFQNAARVAKARPPSNEFADLPQEAARVLRAFVVDGRLQSIPVAPAKRRVVLDWLAQEFEPGRRYSEQMVNLTLGQRHPDTAALRRYLVDDGFLERAGGQYWRAGGTVEP
jgi:hypothetical protein